MYVCVCNAYRESQVRDVIEESAAALGLTAEEIYSRLGGDLRCGRCLVHVEHLIHRFQEETAALPCPNQAECPLSSPGSICR